MVAKTAVLLDTCVIGHKISLDDILRNEGKEDYFITRGVLNELERWKSTDEKAYDGEKEGIEQKLRKVRKLASNKNYESIVEFVKVVELEQGLKHDRHIARILYEGFVKPLQINFKKGKGPLKKYFSSLKETYGEVLKARGLIMEVKEGGARIARADAKRTKECMTVNIKNGNRDRSNRDLSRHFLEYSLLIKAYVRELKQLEQRYENFREAMKIMSYFKLKEDGRVILRKTDDKIIDYSKLTVKSIAKDVYENNYRGKVLGKKDIESFITDVNTALQKALLDSGYWNSAWNGILDRAVNQTRAYIKLMIKNENGYIPINNVNTDANIVSVGRNFASIKEGYEKVRIMTRDSDIEMMVKLCNTFYKPPKIRLFCG